MSSQLELAKVLIAPYNVLSWLYKPLFNVLRQRHGTRFVLLIPEGTDLASEYQPFLADDDEIVEVPDFDVMAERIGQPADAKSALRVAREIEDRYDISILQDILQQERTFAGAFVEAAKNNLFEKADAPDMAHLAATVTAFFDFYEHLFARLQLDAVLLWPRTAHEAVGALVAAQRGLLVTYPYTAKHRNFAYWASGPYCTAYQHTRAFENAPAATEVELHEILPPGRPVHLQHGQFDARHSFSSMLKEFLRHCFFYLEFFVLDVRRGRLFKVKRRPMREVLGKIVHDWWYYRKFVRLCERDTRELTSQRFVLFAFQAEPEFSVQARCKEFNDQRAVVRQLALSLPADVRLVIKEHAFIGDRRLPFYEELVSLPNVVMAHPGISALELIPHCEAVASLAGTVTIEAGLHGKPAIIFGPRSEFAFLPHVHNVDSFRDLAAVLKRVTLPREDATELEYRRNASRMLLAIESIGVNAEPFYSRRSMEIEPEIVERAAELLVALREAHRTEAASGNSMLEQIGVSD
jgi:hypothetical protein